MSKATPKITPTKGMKVSFSNTPQAVDDSITLTEADGDYMIDVMANDLAGGAKQLWSLHGSEPMEPVIDGKPMSLELAGLGTLAITPEGLISFEPTEDFADTINALPEGATAPSFEFWYVIRMANGAFAKAKATITFEGVNDEATIGGDLSATIDEDGVASGTLTVTDVDTGEAKFQDVDEDALTTEWGSFTFNPETGAWTFTPNDNADTLNVGDEQVVTLTVTSLDGTATETITVTITGSNDAAVVTGTATGTVKEDQILTASGTLTATDVDNDDGFQALTGAGLYGTFSIDADGNWTYTLDNDAVQYLNTGDSLTDSFTFLTVDGTEAVVTVAINGTDEPVTVPLAYTPATPDVVIPGTPGQTVDLTYPLPTQSNGGAPLPTGTQSNPLNQGLWNQWQSWQSNLQGWRQTNDPNELDTNTATSTITIYWKQGQQPVQISTITYDNTISYSTPGTPDVTIPGSPAALVLVGGDAFLQWNEDSALTFDGATQMQFEALVVIGAADIDGDADINDTVLLFTDGTTLTLFDAGFTDFAGLFGSGQVFI